MAVETITGAHRVTPAQRPTRAQPAHPHQHVIPQRFTAKTPAAYDPDQIYLTVDPRQAMQMVIKVTGKPSGYTSPAQEQAYIESLAMGTPVAQYDPEGFMARLGLTGIKGAGRTDESFVHAVRQTTYVPDTEVGGHSIWIQGKMFDKLLHDPEAFAKVKNSVGVVMDARANSRKDWTKPLPDKQTLHPTGETPKQRYPHALKGIPNTEVPLTWHEDFHGGVPGQHIHDGGAGYGTYAIAKAVGFSTAQAIRFGEVCNNVDNGKTPYGSTGPSPIGALDRHFNFNRGGEDSRLIFARKHLERAIEYGRKGAYNEAETEIGVGLHSLQDLFAHAQSSTSVHATMGGFLDEPEYSPVGMVEATVATRNYMKAYLKGISSSDGRYAVANSDK
ncbi:MAG: hypothetical protein H7338_15120 [Candidatus Sericytochromatia bacterium]|nr:hypothetical protein [Candidatus Sericytochromatia bacterium]